MGRYFSLGSFLPNFFQTNIDNNSDMVKDLLQIPTYRMSASKSAPSVSVISTSRNTVKLHKRKVSLKEKLNTGLSAKAVPVVNFFNE